MAVMRIRELRESRNMTQKALADALGVTQSVVCNWEVETSLPRSRDLPALARVLGVDVGDLFAPDADAG